MTNRIEGKEFVFTGRIRITRYEAWQLVIKCKGFISSSVTHDTDYAVVGDDPGQKSSKARAYGIEIINEDTFFQWVDEALLEIENQTSEEEITEVEELEEPEVPLTEAQRQEFCWTCPTCNHFYYKEIKECFLCKRKKEISLLSFNNKDTLEKLLVSNPGVEVSTSINCPGCGNLIRYSIYGYKLYYCFTCKHYYTRIDNRSDFEDLHGTLHHYEPGWKMGLVKDPSDLYTLTHQMLAGGYQWKEFSKDEKGSTLINEVGKAIFLTTDELIRNDELVSLRDFGNSLEFLLDVRNKYKTVEECSTVLTNPMGDDVVDNGVVNGESKQEFVAVIMGKTDEELRIQFLEQRARKLARRELKHQERFDQRQEKLWKQGTTAGVGKGLNSPF
jgi:hypothetical protein